MQAWVNDSLRLAILKGTAKQQKIEFAELATHLYRDENTLLESYILTIDKDRMCSLIENEKRVSIRAMCERFLIVLCTPCLKPTLIL